MKNQLWCPRLRRGRADLFDGKNHNYTILRIKIWTPTSENFVYAKGKRFFRHYGRQRANDRNKHCLGRGFFLPWDGNKKIIVACACALRLENVYGDNAHARDIKHLDIRMPARKKNQGRYMNNIIFHLEMAQNYHSFSIDCFDFSHKKCVFFN